MQRVNNARGRFVSFNRGYLYLGANIKHYLIEQDIDDFACDVDIEGNKVTINVNLGGQYSMTQASGGYRVCVFSDREKFERKRYPVTINKNIIQFEV